MRTKYDVDPIQAAIDDEQDKKDLKIIYRISIWVPTVVVLFLGITALVATFLMK